MAAANEFARMVPGFDFFQGLLKGAGAGLPAMGQWVAPTLDPEELEKRIQDLKTVQFWLEQNAKLIAATIQALEVQRMTLSTLQSLNLPLVDLSDALKIKPRQAAPAPAPPPAPAPASTSVPAAAPAAVPDPLLWWGALTKQFGELASQAFKDSTVDGAQSLAKAILKPSVEGVAAALKVPGAKTAKTSRVAKQAPRKASK